MAKQCKGQIPHLLLWVLYDYQLSIYFIFHFFQCTIPLQNFLQPQETNPELLEIYLRCLASGSVRPSWSPIMYVVAVAQLSGFLFSRDNLDQVEVVKTKLRMIRQVLALKNKVSL